MTERQKQIDMFRDAGELLGRLQLLAKTGETVFIGYDEKENVFNLTKDTPGTIYYYTVYARELSEYPTDTETLAIIISERWERIQ